MDNLNGLMQHADSAQHFDLAEKRSPFGKWYKFRLGFNTAQLAYPMSHTPENTRVVQRVSFRCLFGN